MAQAVTNTGVRVINASQTVQVPVWATVTPQTIEEVADALARSSGRVSVSGQRYSPDRQFVLEHALHLDMSRFNQVVRFEPVAGRLRVQAGIRWFEVLKFIQPHGFSVQALPEYGNFSVGGSVGTNAHGHAVCIGPLANSVTALKLVLADGNVVEVSNTQDPDLFRAAVGGFGGLAVIVEVELQLADNVPLLRKSLRLRTDEYVDHFRARIETDPGAVFHLADFYAPDFMHVRSTTWVRCEDRPTNEQPLRLGTVEDPLQVVFHRKRAHSAIGRAYDEHVSDRLRYARKAVHWRNYESSQDIEVAIQRIHDTPSLEFQEYVVGPSRFATFLDRLRTIVEEFRVPVVHLSVCHYGGTSRSLLTLSDSDAFLFRLVVRSSVVQGVAADHSAWTRALVDAALDCNGSFNPAFAMHATGDQFRRAFPGHERLLAVKRRVDPGNRFGNGLWERYMEPGRREDTGSASEFRAALGDPTACDVMQRVVVSCTSGGKGARLFGLVKRLSARTSDDELVYRNLRRTVLKWRNSTLLGLVGGHADWRADLHRKLARNVRRHLERLPDFDGRQLDGVVEIGNALGGLAQLRKSFKLGGQVGQLALPGGAGVDPSQRTGFAATMPARKTAPDLHGLPFTEIGAAPGSLSLMLISGGLSALSADAAAHCLSMAAESLKPGGLLMVLEHDADTAMTGLEASVSTTLSFLCAGESWESSQQHPRAFRSADEWGELLHRGGFKECAARERIDRTPGGDVLLICQRTK